MYQIWVYVPDTQLEQVKNALFAAGAGRIGLYDSCAWQTLGRGQFRPMAGSQPFIGQQGQVEEVSEWRLELVCAADKIAAALDAMLLAHPYEEPAYGVVAVLTRQDF
jgi:hypothetical protein